MTTELIQLPAEPRRTTIDANIPPPIPGPQRERDPDDQYVCDSDEEPRNAGQDDEGKRRGPVGLGYGRPPPCVASRRINVPDAAGGAADRLTGRIWA